MSDVAVSVKGVSKDFDFSSKKSSTLKSVFTGLVKSKDSSRSPKQHALKSIDLDIKKGEFFGIVGRNGSGKSTLLKIIAGIYQPTKGTVRVDGKIVPFIELGVGFNPELTGRENVYLNGAILGFNKHEIDGFYDEVVNFAELEDHMDKKLKNYSSGMQVRLAFSMAIRANADILLIDEVLAVGDADFQRKCYSYFKSLKDSSNTIIFVSHDMVSMKRFCDRIALIEQSKLVRIGKPESVIKQYGRLFETNAKAEEGDEEAQKGAISHTEYSYQFDEDRVIIHCEVQNNTSTEQKFIAGFRIKDSKEGIDLFGSNSKLSTQSPLSVDAGGRYKYSWVCENILASGTYGIVLSITSEDGKMIYDRIEKDLLIKIQREVETDYLLLPDIKLRLEEE